MTDIMNLTMEETRIIGVLIEKEITTPDQYPLSLNALTMGCNQKSNREPVLELNESDVQQTVDELVKKHLVTDSSGFGSRVTKFQHRFCNTEFSQLQFNEQELGIICVMLLRGPQTPGELRTRTNRLCQFSDVQEVESALQHLAEGHNKPYVVKLAREPGKRDSRYAHLFSGEIDLSEMAPSSNTTSAHSPQPASIHDNERLVTLEQQVSNMQEEIEELKQAVIQLKGG